MVSLYELDPGTLKKTQLNLTSPKVKSLNSQIDKIRTKLRQLEGQIEDIDYDLPWNPELKPKKVKLVQQQKELQALLKATTATLQGLMTNVSPSTPNGIRKLATECKQALFAMKATKRLLYRGMNGDSHQMVGHPRADRMPMDSSEVMQRAYDSVLSRMGHKALRSNSIFTTSDYRQADNYGQGVYIIIPKDGFKFTWSPIEDDVVLHELPIKDMIAPADLKRYVAWFTHYLKPYKAVIDTKSSKYISGITNAILDAIDEAKAAGMPQEESEFLVKELERDPPELLMKQDTIVKRYNPMKTDFKAALKSGHEIIIKGDYYALDYDKYGKVLHNWIGTPYNDPKNRDD